MSLDDQRAKFGQFYNADSCIEEIKILSESVVVNLSYAEIGAGWNLTFHRYAAIVQIGVWDESILDHGEVLDDSDLITRTKAEIQERNGESPSPGMGVRQFQGPWYHYRIELIDGSSLNIVAQDVNVERYKM